MGGGTACNEQPQLGQNSKPAFGPERWARSQCPRAEHCGLMHCTVQPGRYCMRVSPVAASPCEGSPSVGMNNNGGDFAPELIWCQEKRATRYSGGVAVWKSGT